MSAIPLRMVVLRTARGSSRVSIFVALLVFVATLLASPALTWSGESENPPPGAPWQRDFLKAQEQALKETKPILFYFTKTY